jgi:hypothetical protein
MERSMTERDEMDATVRLAFWAHGLPRRKPGRLLVARSDTEWARMSALGEEVDRKSAGKYREIVAALSVLIMVVGLGATVVLVAFGPWAAIEIGVLDPSLPANNIWAVALVCWVFLMAGAIGVLVINIKAPPRLAAAWAASDGLRAKLVPQPGDAALLAKCEREMVLVIVFGALVGLVAVPAVIQLVWTISDRLPGSDWLVALFFLLMTPVAAIQVVRWRQRRHAG